MAKAIKLSSQEKIQVNILAHQTLMEALSQKSLEAYDSFTDNSRVLNKAYVDNSDDVVNCSIGLYNKLRESEIARLQQTIYDLKAELNALENK